jgi:hypothetical protein
MLFLKYLLVGCLFLSPLGCLASDHILQPGTLQGQLHIVSPKTVELADGTAPAATAATYAEYPLVVLSQDGKKKIAKVTADGSGHYQLALPPGVYVLDVQDRARKHVRAKPQEFKVVSNQTVHVDVDMDTGIR